MAKSAIDKLLEKTSLKQGKQRYGYVAVYPDMAQAAILDRWTRSICRINFAVPKDEYHVTLMYDKRNKVKRNAAKAPKKGRLFRAEPVNVDVFFPKDGKPALVLSLHSPELSARHAQLKAMGFRHSYQNFKPHLTLKEGGVLKSDFASASANLYNLIESMPKMHFFMETWREIKPKG